MKNLKAQAWGMDLMVAVMLFTMGILLFFIYVLNYPGEAEENINNLFYDGNMIADNILSRGFPEDWNSENVIRIGVMSGDNINETKLEMFYNLSSQNYTKTKQIFNTRFDYYFFFSENISLYSMQVEGIGKPGTNLQSINSRNLVKITRFTSYKDKPTTAYLYVWEE